MISKTNGTTGLKFSKQMVLDSKLQDPGGPHFGPVKLSIWGMPAASFIIHCLEGIYFLTVVVRTRRFYNQLCSTNAVREIVATVLSWTNSQLLPLVINSNTCVMTIMIDHDFKKK